MVEAVASISSSSGSLPTSMGTSLSITSVPDNAWVAARQSRITADLHERAREKEEDDEDGDARHGHAPHKHAADIHGHEAYAEIAGDDEHVAVLSGESERIGMVNFDEHTPFGQRVAIL